MERGVLVGGILISISFLLAVILNRSAMDAAPAQNVHAGARGPAVRVVPRSSIAARLSADAAAAAHESSEGEARQGDRPDKNTEHVATSQGPVSDGSP